MSESSYEGEMTDQRCKDLIDAYGVSRNPMTSVQGEFYTSDRAGDLKRVCALILMERVQTG